MAFTNFETKEINCKIVYFGPRSAGKTTNLRSIYKATSTETKAGLLELDEEPGPTRFFDFLPISLGHVKDFHLKLHLYTIPACSLYESLGSVILKGVDGFVFVADSKIDALDENIQEMNRAKRIFSEEGVEFLELPRIIQYNKRDVIDVVPVEILRKELNPSKGVDHEAVATQALGTMETIQSMAKLILKNLGK